MQKNLVYDIFILFCEIINSIEITVQHFVFFGVMIFLKSYLPGERLPTVIKQIIFIVKVIIKCCTGILCSFA